MEGERMERRGERRGRDDKEEKSTISSSSVSEAITKQ